MRFSKWIPVAFLLAVAAAWPAGFGHGGTAAGGPLEKSSPAKGAAGGRKTGQNLPRYVSVHLKPRLDTIVAGDSGYFDVVASLNGLGAGGGRGMHWDPESKTPVVVWISTPPKSGIAFIDSRHPGQPRHHFLARFRQPEGNLSQPLTLRVKYTVDPKTKAGKHTLWMDILANLSDLRGNRIEDVGIATVPFQVDTHLAIKLTMLAVVAAAVFLFIVEWVRVDVVAIVMMVLLPELDLLNAEDTFRGLSSNAVIAIIGVMIISYGLNRAGLVNRLIRPMLKPVGKSPRRLTVMFSGLIAVISSVMQNTGGPFCFCPPSAPSPPTGSRSPFHGCSCPSAWRPSSAAP